jgi:S-DNA-T family DNA segregation ATPase FtsK/SpoIIIE
VGSSISEKRQRQILAVLLGAFAVLAGASLVTFALPEPGVPPWATRNACGPVGGVLAFSLAWALGLYAACGVPLLAAAWAVNRFRGRPVRPLLLSSSLLALMAFEVCTLLALAGLDRWTWTGAWGMATGLALHSALGSVGSWVVAGALLGVTAIAASELGFHWIAPLARAVLVAPLARFAAAWAAWRQRRAEVAAQAAKKKPAPAKKERPVKGPAVEMAQAAAASAVARPRISTAATPVAPEHEADENQQFRLPLPGLKPAAPRQRAAKERKAAAPAPAPASGTAATPGAEVSSEPLPSLSLLAMPTQPEDLITAADLTSEANLLVAKLADFGIDGRVTEIHPGPVVTTFEFEPAAGVKVNQIVSREDDLALTLRAQRIRILAPIPGKGAVGVEIPNRMRRTVYLREVLSSRAYEESSAALKIPLGVDVVGQPFVADLTKMPHVLVAGATGSGKSVCLNAIITGLLYQHGPDTLRFVMIDPKMLELSAYNGIPHLVMPVVTEPKKASRALRWAVSEMEKRYKLMATCGARNIAGYNEKVASGLAPTAPGAEAPPDQLSYVVVVIDELADLMLTAPAEIEEPIARLAQMARAVGIHLVLATQRPSVDVITGVIKANFPSRIAFQVASKTDSRTVLDMNGAENLLGYGDMLFTPAGKPEPYRVHGCYISEEETARVVQFWTDKLRAVPLAPGAQPAPPPLATRPNLSEAEDEGEDGEEDVDDELLRDAAKLVVTHQQGSTSLLQRRLKVGYSRAGRLMDQLEQIGVVGPFQGSKARDVLVDERWLEDRFGS